MTNTPSMRIFTSTFQIFVRQELPIFILKTGLFENIDELQNKKNCNILI